MPLHWPKCDQPRHYAWYFVFFIGLPVLAGFCAWFAIANPDPKAVYAETDHLSGAALFSSKEEAEAAGATNIDHVHRRLIWWFVWCLISSMSLWVVGFIRNMVIANRDRDGAVIKYLYFFMWMAMLACWGMGIYWRFKASGRYACADMPPSNLDFNSDPNWKVQIMGDANSLI